MLARLAGLVHHCRMSTRLLALVTLVLSAVIASAADAQQPSPAGAPAPTQAADAAEPAEPPPAAPAAPAPSAPPPARAEPASPPLRPFPVPDNPEPVKPADWDVPRFPDRPYASRHNFEAGFGMGIPIWLTRGEVQPGFGFDGRWGFVTGMVVPELGLGWQINGLSDDLGSDRTLDVFYLSFGARARFENHSRVTPFVSGALDLNFWHWSGDTALACGYYYCRESANYDFSPGMSMKGGVAFEVASQLALDAGLRLGSTFATGVFDRTQVWLSPFLALTFYH